MKNIAGNAKIPSPSSNTSRDKLRARSQSIAGIHQKLIPQCKALAIDAGEYPLNTVRAATSVGLENATSAVPSKNSSICSIVSSLIASALARPRSSRRLALQANLRNNL